MPRRNVYLTEEELELVAAKSAETGSSFSFVVRAGVRLLLGLPVPSGFRPPNYTNGELEVVPGSFTLGLEERVYGE